MVKPTKTAPKAPFKQPEDKSMSMALTVLNAKLTKVEQRKYMKIAANPQLNWEAEKNYVEQIIQGNDYLAKSFSDQPQSLLIAMQDAAAMGLSLSPTLGLAYLIPKRPRAGAPTQIMLKVSYKGMEQAVQRSGTVKAITTELVYVNDEREDGVNENGPYFHFKRARSDRGALEGAFCLARYSNGEKHIEWMPIEDLEACRMAAIAAASDKGEPPSWRGPFRPEMYKKCCVRRASKHWPTSPVIELMQRAFDVENPMALDAIAEESTELFNDGHLAQLDEALPNLSAEQRNIWYQRKAEAEGYATVRDVPASLFTKFHDALVARYNQIAAMNAKAKEQIQPTEKATEPTEPTT